MADDHTLTSLDPATDTPIVAPPVPASGDDTAETTSPPEWPVPVLKAQELAPGWSGEAVSEEAFNGR